MSSIYETLSSQFGSIISSSSEDVIAAAAISNFEEYKIGKDSHGYPILFIPSISADGMIYSNVNLKYLSVLFDRECEIVLDNSNTESGRYTLVMLKSIEAAFQDYFLTIVAQMIEHLGVKPTSECVNIEVSKIINLFSKARTAPLKTIQGLWAELLVIERSCNPLYLLKSWHYSTNAKYDFNDGIDKVEVKSTVNTQRVHSFSYEQLRPVDESNPLIISVLIMESAKGENIFNLAKRIQDKIPACDTSIDINAVIFDTLGDAVEEAGQHFYDYGYSTNSIGYFFANDIPCIDSKQIPAIISSIHFNCDISDLDGKDLSTLQNSASLLLSSL